MHGVIILASLVETGVKVHESEVTFILVKLAYRWPNEL